MRGWRCVLAATFAAWGASAQAAWYRADSRHFVIYADESAEDLTAFAMRLERFDRAVRFLRGMDDPPVGDGNRLTIFVLPSARAVQKMHGRGDRYVEGFYTPRATGSLAFVPRSTGPNLAGTLSADTIFFHEYAHHLMFQAVDKPLPPWVVEGFAELMSTVRFEKNGDIGIGLPAYHRAGGLALADSLPLETMLRGDYVKLSPEQRESLYARGWLLVHCLTFEKSRSGQLDRYSSLLAKGTAGLDAARAAFGDLKRLDHDLKVYMNRSQLSYVKLNGAKFPAGDIHVEPLSEGASKVVMLRAQSKRGVNAQTAEPLAVQVRAIETRYPGDELVELTLAEAELDAGHHDAAEAAADRALRANPKNTKALVFKGRSVLASARAELGDQRRASFEEARQLFITANKLDTEDPEPLMLFFRSFVEEGVKPTANAIAALHYASDLAPQDSGLRMTSAVEYLVEGKTAEAKRALIPVAYDPHGRELTQIARSILGKIDTGDAQAALSTARAGASVRGASTPN
jgi:Flp pilus assembly protein TadD